MSICPRRLGLLLIMLGALPSAHAAAVEPGDLLVADPDANAILVLDAQAGTAQTIFAGGPLLYPTGVASALDGRFFVADPVANAIFVLTLGGGPPPGRLFGRDARVPFGRGAARRR